MTNLSLQEIFFFSESLLTNLQVLIFWQLGGQLLGGVPRTGGCRGCKPQTLRDQSVGDADGKDGGGRRDSTVGPLKMWYWMVGVPKLGCVHLLGRRPLEAANLGCLHTTRKWCKIQMSPHTFVHWPQAHYHLHLGPCPSIIRCERPLIQLALRMAGADDFGDDTFVSRCATRYADGHYIPIASTGWCGWIVYHVWYVRTGCSALQIFGFPTTSRWV